MNTNFPIIGVVLGEHIEEVVESSGLERSMLVRMRDVSPFIITEPFIFHYKHQNSFSFSLPPAHHLWLSVIAGRVARIRVNPHLNRLSLQEAHSLAIQIAEMLAATSWQKVGHKEVELENLKSIFTKNRAPHYSSTMYQWKAEKAEILLLIERLGSVDNSSAGEYFTVSMLMRNEELEQELDKKVQEKRRLTGYEHTYLPLSQWPRDPLP